MPSEQAKIDDNRRKALLAITDDVNQFLRNWLVDPVTGRLKVTAIITSGGGLTSLNGLTGGTQTFSDVDDTNVTLTIASTGTAHTFTIGWSGQLSIARGGTGQATAAAGFDALSPTTTEGDITFRNATTNARLAKGTAGQVLTMNAGATAPEWQTPAAAPTNFADNVFYVSDNGDSSKRVAFQVSGVTASTTRTLTIQDADGTIYITGGIDVAVADGGTGASTASDARTNLSAAVLGANGDITSLSGLTGAVGTPTSITMANGGSVRSNTTTANTMVLQAYDVDGAVYTTFITFTNGNTPTCDISDSVTKSGQYIYRGSGTDVAIADGGTGQSTATLGFDALSPLTTQGDIIYHNGTNNVRLAKGTALQQLRMNSGATAPEWASSSGFSYLGSAVLGVAATSISVGSLPANVHLRVIFSCDDLDAGDTTRLEFNGDTGNNYGQNYSGNGAASTASNAIANIMVTGSNSTNGLFVVLDITAPNAGVKRVVGMTIQSASAGANPYKTEFGGYWIAANTDITSIKFFTAAATAKYPIGAKMIVYGYTV